MATFIEIQTDGFADNVAIAAASNPGSGGVRRPFRGIEVKQDTYAMLRVLKANGKPIPLVDAGGPGVVGQGNNLTSTYNYSNFIIQGIQDAREEKQQVLETFGDSYIFFFGERPRILLVNGLLMNTTDFNWRTEFWYNYENTLRGTKLVEQDARIYLYWDDIVVEGYMLAATAKDDSNLPYHIPFSFHLFVTNHTYLSTIGDDDYPITHAVNLDNVLRQSDVEGARRELKARDIAKETYLSNIDKTRIALQVSATTTLLTAGLPVALSGNKLPQNKQLLATALAMGINAQNLSFSTIVNGMFRRKMRMPQRQLPYRSKIRDNVDEYVGTLDAVDDPARKYAWAGNSFPTKYDLERQALGDLMTVGINPVQHPGGSPFGVDHALVATGGVMPASGLLSVGFGVGGVAVP